MKSLWAATALALFVSNAAAAESCGPLRIVGQVDMISTDPVLIVPAKLNDHPIKLVFDTGGWFMEISPSIAKTLELPLTKRSFGGLDVAGHLSNQTVTAKDFEIGSIKAKDVPFLVNSHDFGTFDGLMGPKLVQIVDVDLDFAGKKISFMLQDHCEGKVVYWKTPSYAVVPFTLTDAGHIRMPVELDGVKLTASLDTGASQTFISERAAERNFDLVKGSPGVTETDGEKGEKKYSHTFKTLTVGGITFQNPTLDLLPDLMRNHLINSHKPKINSLIDTNNEAEGLDDLIVGMKELKHLHIYIAYKEQKLYISPASTPQPTQTATP
jgi:predicted aspartyl protease